MNSLSASSELSKELGRTWLMIECAHCQELGLECTYLEAAKRRGPAKGYVEALEQRCGRLEQMFKQVRLTQCWS